jgi:hypothetical protein
MAGGREHGNSAERPEEGTPQDEMERRNKIHAELYGMFQWSGRFNSDDTSCRFGQACLFRIFVAAGMKIGDKIIHFRLMEDVCEGWHLVTAVKDLRAYLIFA